MKNTYSDTFFATDKDEIYEYYKNNLIPALTSSLPLLFKKIKEDSGSIVHRTFMKIVHLLIPFTREDFEWHAPLVPHVASEAYGNLTQFILNQFDSDHDGHISASELLHVNLDNFPIKPQFNVKVPTRYTGPILSRLTSWPLVDWNLATLLWRSCGGLLLIVIAASIIPGRLHGLSGSILRWPVLALTYLTIASELVVYIMVRLFIRALESIFATKKHRQLRKALDEASSYEEWLGVAKKLDYSQARDEWQCRIDDETSYTYNWAFINELIADMREARKKDDVMLALVVLQQCTRKNVGGIMNEDLFSFTNSGEPKFIVKEFLEEVVKTVKWLAQVSSYSNEASEEGVRTNEEKSEHGDKCHEVIAQSETQNREAECAIKKNIVQVVMDHAHILDHVVGPVQWALHVATGGGRENGPMKQEMKKISEECRNDMSDSTSSNHEGRNSEEDIDDVDIMRKQQREQVKLFMKRARAAYGRTALCLSGGAMMGCYHFGHVMALFEEGVLPHIISGTSAGSVVAAMLCTRTDDEIRRDMRPEVLVNKLTCFTRSWPDRFRSVYQHGCLFDQEEWMDLIQWFCCGDMTFEEAYKKTGRVLCITLSSTTKKAPPVLVNYITAPHVTIASAIIASAAVPGFIKPVILRKKGSDGVVRKQAANKDEAYWDGSIDQDIPTSGLAEMFNCHFFLTAQCNPHVVPFFHSSKGCVGQPSRWMRRKDEKAWRGGFLLAALELYLKNDMRSKFHFLNDLEAAVGFTSTMMTQIFHGSTTIVPHVSPLDYFCLFSNPTLPFLKKCFQVGHVATYKHCAMMKLHYSVSDALDECLIIMEKEDGVSSSKPRRRLNQLAKLQYYQEMGKMEILQNKQTGRGFALGTSSMPRDVSIRNLQPLSCEETEGTVDSSHDDDYDLGSF
eukprot:CAMPEP_0176502854 /NCGR_PEP_ID=MMETSP0200_2-20121128/15005_1 /TAXON_ID=947934 /ORGANISM="Chaetoceros sp., Strain GSL56" /LENGTH=903 /DNA_ID=CAMNT_0017902013 /DNA_START=281 /DNA_END=2992 /DNA_ORIENTATION=-